MPSGQNGEPLLAVDELKISSGSTELVHGVSLSIVRGEALGLVGESGSGKSLTCRAVLGALPEGTELSGGRIEFEGTHLEGLNAKQWLDVRGRIGAVFQDPASYLNPSLTVGYQITEVLRVRGGMSRKQAKERAAELLRLVGLNDISRIFPQIPTELSGGMQQRVMLAIAVALDPVLVVADEPTTALDVKTQAEVLRLLRSLRDRLGLSLMFVSHDLDIVLEICDRIAVFRDGSIVEVATPLELTSGAQHPYTRFLLRAAGYHVQDTQLEEVGTGV